MDESQLMQKKRRHQDSHYRSEYHARYKKHNIHGQRGDWRSVESFRDKDRYSDHTRGGTQFNADSKWDVEINLIGIMEQNPMIHLCDTCRLPIRSYGRLIPCKHVFCFKCAKKTDKNCPRCSDEVHRIEQCRHGTVWMCSVANCSRTYLSQRDLQAHINHRHNKPSPLPPITVPPPHLANAMLVPPPPVSTIPPQVPPYVLMPPTSQPPPSILSQPTDQSIQGSQEVVARPNSNLITIQIQDNPTQQAVPSARSGASGQWSIHPNNMAQNRNDY